MARKKFGTVIRQIKAEVKTGGGRSLELCASEWGRSYVLAPVKNEAGLISPLQHKLKYG